DGSCLMTRRPLLAVRAVLAVALTLAFYGLALSVSFGLLWLAYVDVRAARPAYPLVLFCVARAAAVLWAGVSPGGQFEAPGPRLTEMDHPELFALLRDIANSASEPMPADVYLINDVNAFVTQRGGMLSTERRRVMGLGLPLMAVLTVDELKGVVAHEF